MNIKTVLLFSLLFILFYHQIGITQPQIEFKDVFVFKQSEPLQYRVKIKTNQEEKTTGRKGESFQEILYTFYPKDKIKADWVWDFVEVWSKRGTEIVRPSELPKNLKYAEVTNKGDFRLIQGQGVNIDLINDLQFPKIPAELSENNSEIRIPFNTEQGIYSWAMKGTQHYKYLGQEKYNDLECIKYSLTISGKGIVPKNENGFANILAETTVFYSIKHQNYVFVKAALNLENRILLKNSNVNRHLIGSQTFSISMVL